MSALGWYERVPSVQECAPLCRSLIPHSFTPTAQHLMKLRRTSQKYIMGTNWGEMASE